MRRSGRSTPRALLVLVPLVLVRVAVAQSFVNLTVSSRLAKLASFGIDSPGLQLISTLPVEIRYLLTSNGLSWSDLGGTLQRLVLWDAGYVVTSSNTTREVKVKCDLGMDDIVVSYDEFYQLNNCPTISCTDSVDGANVRRGTVCADDQIKNAAKCAVIVSKAEVTAASVNVETNMIWGEEGNNTDVPLPTVLRHSLKSFVITLQPTSSGNGGCPQQLGLVIPCTTILSADASVNSSGWCPPRKSGVVTGLLKDLVEYRQEQEDQANADDAGSSASGLSLAIWAIGAALGIILCIIGFLYHRRLRNQRKYPINKCAILEKSPHGLASFDSNDMFFVETNNSQDKTGSMSADLSDLEAEIEVEMHKIDVVEDEAEKNEVDYSDALGASQVLLLFQNDPAVLEKRVPIIDVGGDKVLSRRKDKSATEVLVGCLGPREVVLKRIRSSRRNDTRAVERLAREIRMTISLEHTNIARLVGTAWNSFQNLVAIWELQSGGDLRLALHSGKKSQHWTWAYEKLEIATGVIRGLVYLHTRSPPIVHGAIEPGHILLDAGTCEPALCGFGNCAERASISTPEESPSECGVWSSPEVLAKKNFSDKADVYSFGVILVALDTSSLLTGVSGEDLLEHLTPECPEAIRQIARDCLQNDPKARPMSESILRRVEDIRSSRGYRKTHLQQAMDGEDDNDNEEEALFCL